MKKIFVYLIGFFLICCINSCSNSKKYRENISYYENPVLFHQSMKKLSDIIVYDIFSPPVASRIYAYPSIAAYEVLINDHIDYKSFAGQLNELSVVPRPDDNLEYSFPVASLHAFLIVGREFIFSEEKIDEFQKELYADIKAKGIPSDIFSRSLEYGELVASHIIDWANTRSKKITRRKR